MAYTGVQQKETLPHLIAEVKDHHQLWVTLNFPERMNAISVEMVDSLTDILARADFDSQIRVIIIKGAGEAFSAGGDVVAMQEKSGMFAGGSNELRIRYQHGIQKIPKCFEDLSKPVIAMVNGAAVGAGCDLAMMCDLRVGSEKSKFAESFSKLGLVPGDGGCFFLTRAIGYAKAMEMTLTADFWEGKDAHNFGLLNHFTSHDQLESETKKLADKIASRAPIATQMAKRALRTAYLHDLSTTLDLLSAYQGIAQRTQDHENAVQGFLKKTPTKFTNK